MIQDIDKIFNFLLEKKQYEIHNDGLEYCKLCDTYIRENEREDHLDSTFHIYNENNFLDENGINMIKTFDNNDSCPMCRHKQPNTVHVSYVNYEKLTLKELQVIANMYGINIMIPRKDNNGMKYMKKKDIIQMIKEKQ
jgi:hypothetical protein